MEPLYVSNLSCIMLYIILNPDNSIYFSIVFLKSLVLIISDSIKIFLIVMLSDFLLIVNKYKYANVAVPIFDPTSISVISLCNICLLLFQYQ